MGYEMGFVQNVNGSEKNYWYWCGWENVKLHDLFVFLCGDATSSNSEDEVVIPIEQLSFISSLSQAVKQCTFFTTYQDILEIDPILAEEYISSIGIEDKVAFAKNFKLKGAYTKYQPIANILYNRSIDGSYMLETLAEAYEKMIEDNITEVICYGG